jgi:hypothetical protein
MTTVVVGCAVPNGVKLRLHQQIEKMEPIPGGYRTVKVWEAIPDAYITLDGNAKHLVQNDPRSPNGFGYRIHRLSGRDAELFLQWTKQQGKDCYLIDSKALIWHEEADHVEDQAEDLVKQQVKTGLEPIDPDNLPAEFRGRRLKLSTAVDDMRTQPQRREVAPFMHHQGERQRRRQQTANGNGNTSTNERVLRTKRE